MIFKFTSSKKYLHFKEGHQAELNVLWEKQ